MKILKILEFNKLKLKNNLLKQNYNCLSSILILNS